MGVEILTEHGAWAKVERIFETESWEQVYNLRVAEFHTYFVGCDEWGFSVWAHNACYVVYDQPGGKFSVRYTEKPGAPTKWATEANGDVKIFANQAEADAWVASHKAASSAKLPGGAVGTLRDLTPADLARKPAQSPVVDKWVGKGGKVQVDSNGTWVYTDWEGNVVAYPGGHPDFVNATLASGGKAVKFEANVKQVPNYTTDYTNAEKQLGRKYDPATERWHHHEGGEKMLLVDKKYHNRFTHEGGVAAGGAP